MTSAAPRPVDPMLWAVLIGCALILLVITWIYWVH